MALQQMAWFGSTPIGALLMGWVIQISSPRVPFAIGGLATITCATAFLLIRRADRPVRDIAVTQLGRPAAAPFGGKVTFDRPFDDAAQSKQGFAISVSPTRQ